MLDVHPPHHPTHTWRDFFIHIATISVGLLIAIGLEQTVEFLHHRHQLHQLDEDLHAESLRNLRLAVANIGDCEEVVAAGNATYREVVLAHRDHRSPILSTAGPRSQYVKPAYAAWTAAQQNGTLGLLPRGEAEPYVRIYSLVDQASDALVQQVAAVTKLHEALAPGYAVLSADQLNLDPVAKTSAAWAALDPDDFRDARNALAQINNAYQYSAERNVYLYGIEWSVLHGSRSDQENLRVLFDAIGIYRRSGKAALLARYPLPPDAPPQDGNPPSATPKQ